MRFELPLPIDAIAPRKWPRKPGHFTSWKNHQQRNVHYEWIRSGAAPALRANGLPSQVLLTRCSKGTLDDDNLKQAFKYIRDELAICLGLVRLTVGRDMKLHGHGRGDEKMNWDYAQSKVHIKPWGVRVTLIWEKEEADAPVEADASDD